MFSTAASPPVRVWSNSWGSKPSASIRMRYVAGVTSPSNATGPVVSCTTGTGGGTGGSPGTGAWAASSVIDTVMTCPGVALCGSSTTPTTDPGLPTSVTSMPSTSPVGSSSISPASASVAAAGYHSSS